MNHTPIPNLEYVSSSEYDLVYVSSVSRRVVFFKKINERLFEASDGTRVTLRKIKLYYSFHSEVIKRNTNKWVINENGFKVRSPRRILTVDSNAN